MVSSTLFYEDGRLFPKSLFQFLYLFFKALDRGQNGLIIDRLSAPLIVLQKIGSTQYD